ncbi:3-hydroxy acid dehydrogenase [Acrasis kona]|uniref:3-hydroxy acid dehydrogenase n=1 Tax=Acrasis kona TaxID=1008807 RepID=A0AAW2Z158_9EUKA
MSFDSIDLKGKNAIVTGASSGIGEGIAIALSKQGCNVALLARTKEKLDVVADKCRANGVTAYSIPTDLADKNSIDESINEVGKVFSTVHIFISNAGAGGEKVNSLDTKTKSGEDVVDMWERVMNTNLVNNMRITNRVLQLMKECQHGSIIAISSLAATMTGSNMSHYHASKWGLNGFLGSVYEDVREHGIKVCSIMPGFVNTPMVQDVQNVDFDKMIQIEDIVNGVLYVAKSPYNVCPTEIKYRPQYTPYKK